MEAHLWVRWDRWSVLHSDLARSQASARINPVDPGATLRTTEPLHVSPDGGRDGSVRGLYMRWGLNSSWGSIYIADRSAPHRHPNVKVRITGLSCLRHGALACWVGTLAQIRELGGRVNRNALVRVDLATDVAGMNIDQLDKAYARKRYRSQAHSHSRHMSNGVTLTFGASPLQFKVYDKLAELTHAHDVKRQLMLGRRFNGSWPVVAVRGEFQVERGALTRFGVDTVENFFSRRADLVAHLLKFIQFFASNAGNKPAGQRRPHPDWTLIADGFRSWAGEPSGNPLTPLPKLRLDSARHMKAAIGSLIAAAATEGQEFTTTEEFAAYIATSIHKNLPHIQWKDRLAIKRRAIDQGTP